MNAVDGGLQAVTVALGGAVEHIFALGIGGAFAGRAAFFGGGLSPSPRATPARP